MTTPLKILSLLLVLLLAGAAFARNVPFSFVFFDTLRGQPSFEASVGMKAWWDPKDTNQPATAGFTKEGKVAKKPQLWIMVTQTNGARLQLIWEDAGTQHQAFSRSLQLSNTYRFPDVWDEFVAPKLFDMTSGDETPNHALQRTRPSHRCCNRGVPRAGSLSLGR